MTFHNFSRTQSITNSFYYNGDLMIAVHMVRNIIEMPHLDVVEPSVIGNNCIILTVTKIGVEPVEVDDINGHGVENENKPDPPPFSGNDFEFDMHTSYSLYYGWML